MMTPEELDKKIATVAERRKAGDPLYNGAYTGMLSLYDPLIADRERLKAELAKGDQMMTPEELDKHVHETDQRIACIQRLRDVWNQDMFADRAIIFDRLIKERDSILARDLALVTRIADLKKQLADERASLASARQKAIAAVFAEAAEDRAEFGPEPLPETSIIDRTTFPRPEADK